MRTRVVGSGGHSPPYGWIPAPRSHEDKLRGNDGRECRDSSLPGVWGCRPNYPFSTPRMGARGLKQGYETDPQHQTPTGHQGDRKSGRLRGHQEEGQCGARDRGLSGRQGGGSQETVIDWRASCMARCPFLSLVANWQVRLLGRTRRVDRFPYGLCLPHLLLLRINKVVDGLITVGALGSSNPSGRRQR